MVTLSLLIVLVGCKSRVSWELLKGDCAPTGEEIWYDGVDQDCDGNDADQDGDGFVPDAYVAAFPDWQTTLSRHAELRPGDCWDDPNDDTFLAEATDDGRTLTPELVSPDAIEVCDGVDNDCDGALDDGALEWTLDGDDDGYGDPTTALVACTAPDGSAWVTLGGDCDDDDPAVNPSAELGCDGVDHDCDGAIDNDLDGDGASDLACGGTDCDDDDPVIVPEANGDCALGGTCDDILIHGRGSEDGDYLIDPDGAGQGLPPFVVTCDMTGGGWTLVPYAADLPFDEHFTDGDQWQWLPSDFTLTLSDAQIEAIRARSIEGEQRYVGLCADVIHYFDDWAQRYNDAFGFRLHDGAETPFGKESYSPYNIQVLSDGCQFNGDGGGLEEDGTIFLIVDLGVPVMNVRCYDCGTDVNNERFGSPLTAHPAKFR
ncbi:MAG: hypothetical protein IPN01_38015 [Deltaproteobacteria bacterium]|nr:hypothetical protein [Deltaproteobacteria bacterium]